MSQALLKAKHGDRIRLGRHQHAHARRLVAGAVLTAGHSI
jgi:hypothetical protein